jgi:hypothetical protein
MRLISEQEAADRIGRSRRFVYELRRNGQLEYIPAAGRAKVMIVESSLDLWIKENTWQRNNSPRASKKSTETGMSFSRKVAEARERAFGQMIFQSRKAVSKGG